MNNFYYRLSKYVVIFILLSKAVALGRLQPILWLNFVQLKNYQQKFEYLTNILPELKKKIILLIFLNLR